MGRSNAEKPSGGTTSESETINFIELVETEDLHDEHSEIRCIESCLSNKNNGDYLRCNLCMVWSLTACLGIMDIEAIGAWVCGTCRQMPKTIKLIQSQKDTIMSSTNTILQTFANFSEKLEQNFVKLNDRVATKKSGYNIRHDRYAPKIKILKSDVEKKTDTIVSKSCSISDKVKATADLVNSIKDNQSKIKGTSDQLSNDTSSHNNVAEAQNGQTQSTNSKSKTPPRNHNNVNSTQEKRNPVQEKQNPLPKRDNTFITGSGILQSIDTKIIIWKAQGVPQ